MRGFFCILLYKNSHFLLGKILDKGVNVYYGARKPITLEDLRMKKSKLSLMALLLAMVFMTSPAMAKSDMSGVYVGLKFIDSIQGHGFDGFGGESGVWQNTVGGAAFVGYDFYYKFDVPVRAELEYALRSDWTQSDSYYSSGFAVDYDMQVNVQTLLFNVYYDFRNSSKFTPYIGAGIGLAFTRAHIDVNTSVLGFHETGSAEAYSTDFAWQVGAGVAYAITDNVSADLGYRYLGISGSFDDYDRGFGGAHEFSFGIRFTF